MAGRELNLEEKIRFQLHATGERDRLKQLLVTKLEASGWRDEIKARTKEYVEKQGKDGKVLSVDEIVKAVRPQGRCAMLECLLSPFARIFLVLSAHPELPVPMMQGFGARQRQG